MHPPTPTMARHRNCASAWSQLLQSPSAHGGLPAPRDRRSDPPRHGKTPPRGLRTAEAGTVERSPLQSALLECAGSPDIHRCPGQFRPARFGTDESHTPCMNAANRWSGNCSRCPRRGGRGAKHGTKQMNIRVAVGSTLDFAAKLEAQTLTVGVIGLGYVGLPLIHAFWQSGIRVLGFDIDQAKIDRLDSGGSYINHFSPEKVQAMAKSGRFSATSDFSRLAAADAILICVPTPL